MAKEPTPIEELLKIAPAAEWKDLLFQILTTLIDCKYVQNLTDSGTTDFTVKVQGLYNYFARLQNEEKS